MNAKDRLMSMLSACDYEREHYFSELFKYVPNIVADDVQYIRAEKDECIIPAGAPSDYVYFVLSGDVKGVDYNRTGEAYSFMDFSKMYIIGDFEVFTGSPEYANTIYAAKECKLLMLSSAHYLNWIRHDENALFLRLNNILGNIADERRQDRFFLHKGCRARVINYLIHYYEKHRSSSKEQIRIALTQSELADKVGSNLRSVQRVISALRTEELITIENRKMLLSNEQYLRLVEIEK